MTLTGRLVLTVTVCVAPTTAAIAATTGLLASNALIQQAEGTARTVAGLVAEHDGPRVVGRRGIGDHPFGDQLAGAAGVDRALRVVLRDRDPVPRSGLTPPTSAASGARIEPRIR